MDEGFKPGDLVQLKSGGPVMTVDHVSTDGETVYCDWFSGSKHEDGSFNAESLVRAKGGTSKKR